MGHGGIVGFVRHLADPDGYAQETDRELLSRFVGGRDEVAFETLVRRYAQLVRSTAARVLVDPGDIDDATQATFLVLIQRAAREDWRGRLGPWLYGVAHRVAVKLLVRSRRRPGPLGDADPADPASLPDLCWREACDLLHLELDRLPDRYRLPLLLCYLEGQTRDEAAATLGVTVGTVKGRVRRGCELLRRRLARQGVSLSVGLLATAAARPVSACPSSVIAVVCRVPSPPVAKLVLEITHTMVSATNKLIIFGLIAAIGLVAVAGLVAGFSPDTPRRLVPVAAPIPKSAPNWMFLVQNPDLVCLDADGKEKEKIAPSAINGHLSPDGRWQAAFEFDPQEAQGKLVIRSRTKKVEPITIPLVFGQPARSGGEPIWSADSGRMLIGESGFGKDGARKYAYRVYDLAAKTLTDVKLPDGCSITDWSIDGKRFLATVRPSDLTTARVAWLNADGTGKPEFVSPEGEIAYSGRLSPDGKQLLYQSAPEPKESKEGERLKVRLYVMDLATKKRTAVDEPGETFGHCWSPDGLRVAYTWQRSLNKPADVPERETLLITCDSNGRNRKTVTSRKTEISENSSGRSSVVYFFWVVDWR
jgi:RNA polymerase sigma factor (sigma-70 family)